MTQRQQETLDLEKLSSVSVSATNLAPLVALSGNSSDTSSIGQNLRNYFENSCPSFLVSSTLGPENRFDLATKVLKEKCQQQGLRRVTLFGIGDSGALAQAFALESPRLVRRLVLFNATTRPAPNLTTRIFDRLENLLPLGLPLRKLGGEYDSRPFLHRIEAPVLVLTDKPSGTYLRNQAELIWKRCPNSWLRTFANNQFDGSNFGEELLATIKDFLTVPIKRPSS